MYQEIWGQQKQRLYQQAMGASKKEDKAEDGSISGYCYFQNSFQ